MSTMSANRLLYRQEQLPIFQNRMYDTAAEAKACPKGDVVLVEDQQTGLVYNEAFNSEMMVYDKHYQNEQAVSPLFQKHLKSVSEIIGRSMGQDSLVEIGCGKGYFLELLLEKGYEVIGFDPTYEGNNPLVRRQYFQSGVNIRANGLILRHVLEHIQDPVSFLTNLKDANGGNGRIYIEVPCFEWICNRRAWFDIFYEHVNYFRLSDFYRMFGTVVESGRLFGGQYLYVVAELATLRKPEFSFEDRVNFPTDFTNTLQQTKLNKTKPTAIWGAASKGVIFALLKARAGQSIGTAIDINPAKQGKFLAGTGLLVISPEEALEKLPDGTNIFVMNSNYLEEIMQTAGNKFHYIGVDHE